MDFQNLAPILNQSRLRYVLFDGKPLSRVLILVDDEYSFLRTRRQLRTHTPNVSIMDFHNFAPILHQTFFLPVSALQCNICFQWQFYLFLVVSKV